MFTYSTQELFGIEKIFGDVWNVDPTIIRNLIFEFQDLDLHKYVEDKRRKVDQGMIQDWGVHKEIILLYIMTRISKPKIVLETGTAGGVSDAYILQAMDLNGIKSEFHSIGTQSLNIDFPLGYCIPDELKYGDLVEYHQYNCKIELILLQLLNELQDINIFFHDSDHCAEAMYWELENVLPFMDGIIFAHDVNSNRGFQTFLEDYGLDGIVFTREDPIFCQLGIIP